MYGIDAYAKDDNKFTIGDWVHIIKHESQGCMGFITGRDPRDGQYMVRVTKNQIGKKLLIKLHVSAEPYQLVQARIERNGINLSPLIDQALDNGDKELFMWLTSLDKEGF